MRTRARRTGTAANLGFAAGLWAAADALRNDMDAAECKHVAPGLIFLKHIADAFEARHAELAAEKTQGAAGLKSRFVISTSGSWAGADHA